MIEILVPVVFLFVAGAGAYLYLRGEKVGEVRGTLNDLDDSPFGQMRIVVSRRVASAGDAARIDLKVMGLGFVRVIDLDAPQAEELSWLLEEAARSTRP